MSALRVSARIASRAFATILLAAMVAPATTYAAVVEGGGTGSLPVVRPRHVQAPRAAPKTKPLAVRVVSGDETATVTIRGGKAPFKITMLGDSGPLPLYSGAERSVVVPLLAGKTDYKITSSDYGYSQASGWGTTKFWVADPMSRMVRRYDAAENTVTASVWVRGDETTSAVSLRNVVVRPSDDHVFVVFSDNVNGRDRNRLVELDSAGSFVATIPVPGAYKIQDITFDSSNNIYVSDRGGGTYASNRVGIFKLSPTGTPLESTQTVLPSNTFIGYPYANLTTMIEYQPIANRLIARINTGTFAVMNPSTLAIESYRFSGDYSYTCMTLNTSDETSVTLYTGGSGFNLPPFFGKQRGFLNDSRYLNPSVIQSPFHDWKVAPTLPAITDVAVDSNNYVYTIQHDGANGITRAYVVNPDGSAVKTIDLPDGTKIAVVR